MTPHARRLAVGPLAAALLALAAPGMARAQANLSFSGGNGAPLLLTLDSPITYVITAPVGGGAGPFFDFQGVGNILPGSATSVTGTVAFSIAGGGPITPDRAASNTAFGAVAGNDVFIFSSLFPGVAAGDVVTLSAGTLTTAGNYAPAPPAGGSFNTFVFDGSTGDRVSPNGIALVPEPGTWALLVGGGLGLLGLGRRRRRNVSAVRRA